MINLQWNFVFAKTTMPSGGQSYDYFHSFLFGTFGHPQLDLTMFWELGMVLIHTGRCYKSWVILDVVNVIVCKPELVS
jgi:hypothetical protein